MWTEISGPASETPPPVSGHKHGELLHPIPTGSSLDDFNPKPRRASRVSRSARRQRPFPVRGCPRCPVRAPAQPPGPRGEPRRLLTFPSPPQRVWQALRAAPGPGRGAGGGGAGLGGSGRVRAGGAGTVPRGGEGAVGSPRARGRAWPSRRRCERWGAAEGRRGPGRGAGGSLRGQAGRSSLWGRLGARQGAGREAPRPGSRGRGARIRGAVLSPRLTNQSGPAEPGDWHRGSGPRGSPAGPALPAAGRPDPGPAARAALRSLGCGRARAARAGAAAGRGRSIPGLLPRPGPPSRARSALFPHLPSVAVTSSGPSVCPSLPASVCLSPSPVSAALLSPFLSPSLPVCPALLLNAPLFLSSDLWC